jgi:hypothetical protein
VCISEAAVVAREVEAVAGKELLDTASVGDSERAAVACASLVVVASNVTGSLGTLVTAVLDASAATSSASNSTGTVFDSVLAGAVSVGTTGDTSVSGFASVASGSSVAVAVPSSVLEAAANTGVTGWSIKKQNMAQTTILSHLV